MSHNRIALERTIGRITLDRMNGYEVGSVADIFREYGGDDRVTISVLERSFGGSFDEVARRGRDAVTAAVAKTLRAELGARGLRAAACESGFRDQFFHLDPTMELGEVLGPRFQARAKMIEGEVGGRASH